MLVDKLWIKNFKSVELLGIEPKRVNVFIGPPNSGKTNIIEALSFLSKGFDSQYREIIRFEEATDLFTDFETSKPIKIETPGLSLNIEYEKREGGTDGNIFLLEYSGLRSGKHEKLSRYAMKYNGETHHMEGIFETRFFHYIFKPLTKIRDDFEPFLEVPYGQNIPNLLKTNPELRNVVNSIFREQGFRLLIKKAENKITMARVLNDDILIDFKYSSISTTLQRIIFMLLAIKSNKDVVLIFDEPEANTYPFYTQQIATHIANDKSNQYFMTSHSSYLINKLIDKTPPKDLNIYLTQMRNYRTEVTLLNPKQMEDFSSMGEDAMLNLDNIAA